MRKSIISTVALASPGVGYAFVPNRPGCCQEDDVRAESSCVRTSLRQPRRRLDGVHLSYLQQAVRHLRPMTAALR